MTFDKKDVIYLPECHSTNEYLQDLVKSGHQPEGMTVITDYQSDGKGQRGSKWESDPAANLLFSVLSKPVFLQATQAFYMTMISALTLRDILHIKLKRPPVIKWPNDLYFNRKKISGILSESSISGRHLEYVIIGVGLNVNQQKFRLTSATSMFLESGDKYSRSELLFEWKEYFEDYYEKLRSGEWKWVKQEYEQNLLWINELHAFRDTQSTFEGRIIGTNEQGLLKIIRNGTIYHYGMKEISFIQ